MNKVVVKTFGSGLKVTVVPVFLVSPKISSSEIFELRYKTQIIKAETKEQAISFLKKTQKHIVAIKNIREIKQQNFYDKGREL